MDASGGVRSKRVGRGAVARCGSSRGEETSTDAPAGRLLVHVGSVVIPATLNARRRWGRREEGGASGSGPQRILAPMPGKIVRILVKTGEAVIARQPIAVVEAMKMENELRAARDGTVSEIHTRDGAPVEAGTLLVVIQ